MGNSKKGTSVEEKGLLFSGKPKDFEQFRTVMHNISNGYRMSFETQTITKVFQNIVEERTEKSDTTQGSTMDIDVV